MTKKILKVFLTHISRYKWLTFILLTSTILVAIAKVTVPWFYKKFFDALAATGVSADETAKILITTLIIITGIHFLTWTLQRIKGFISVYHQSRIMADLQQTSFNWMIHQSYSFFANNFSGSLVRKVNRLARAFEDIEDNIIFDLIPLIITTAGILIVLFSRHVYLGAGLLVWVIIFLLISYLIARWKLKYDLKKAEADSKTTAVLADAITGSTTIKLFSGFNHEKSLYKKATNRLHEIRTFTWNLNETIDAAQSVLMISIEFILLYFSVRLWQKGILTIGDFVLIQVYLLTLFQKMWSFGRVLRRIYEGVADATEMVQILDTPHGIQDSDSAKPLKTKRGEIEFQEVSFSFRKTRRILNDFSLHIKDGEKVALVGPSGAGKTTIASLLLRLHDLDHGRILIDGTDIAKVTQESLRNHVSLVPQDPILFHRTLMENIKYGRANATDKEVINAAKRAHCHEFIQELSNGYDTYVGERGIKLSGGERQRVAIARAILKNAPILILDEATSSLDSKSEELIQDALKEVMKNKTTIVIAHRLSTIMQMDRIIVISRGKVTDQGTHQELLQKDGIYKTLWSIQAGGFIP